MKKYFINLLLGIPLGLGVMFTLTGITQVIANPNDPVGGIVLGLLGLPLLYASISKAVDS